MTSTRSDLGSCRYYEAVYPAEEELVMVKVERIEDLGAYVSLLEYNNIEGMILMSELSKVRFRSVNRLIRVGRREVVMVLRVDSTKGYIDLSKRRVSPEDIIKCEDRFSKAKKVHQTIRNAAAKHNWRVDKLNELITWPLQRVHGNAFDALKEAVANPDSIFSNINVPPEIKHCILDDLKLRLAPQPVKLRVKIDVVCSGYDGIEAVKQSLIAGKQSVDLPNVTIDIRLIAPPQYMIVTMCYDEQVGRDVTEKVLEVVSTEIAKFKGGDYKQHGAITIMGEDEDKKLLALQEEEDDVEDESDSEDETMGRVSGHEETMMPPTSLEAVSESVTEGAVESNKVENA